MPKVAKHLDYGIYACIPYFFLAMAIHHAGLISPPESTKFIVLGIIALVIGSDLPDIDAKKAPIHGLLMVIAFTALFIGSIKMYSLPHLSAATLAIASIIALEKYMPGHRKFIHTIRANLIFGCLLSIASFYLGASHVLAIWLGLSLFVGCILHLVVDNHLKL